MHSALRLFVIAAFVCTVPRVSQSQSWLSAGLAAGIPGANGGGNHAMATLEIGPARFPVRFRADLAAVDYATSGPRFAQLNASLLVPFLDRPLTPYAIAGLALAPTTRFGSTGTGGDGLRAGMGLRYRVADRVLFVESARHWGLNRSLITLGVQF